MCIRDSYKVGDYSLYTGALNSISTGIATLITTTASIYEGTLFIDKDVYKRQVLYYCNISVGFVCPIKH